MGPVIAKIVIGIVVVAAVGVACYGVYKIGKWFYSWIKCKLFRHEPNTSFVQVGQATNQQIQNIQGNIQPVDIQWKKIQITPNDIQYLEALSTEQFWDKVQLYECAIAQGNQVMRKPVGMKCCQGKQLADKSNLLRAFANNPHKCPMCGSYGFNITHMIQDGKFVKMAEEGIQTLRKRIRITFNSMNPQLKNQLESIVKECFGSDYKI